MKKLIVVISSIVMMMLMSCTAADKKRWSQNFSYKDPQTIGGYWTVIDSTGTKYEHCKCTYWGTDDDTSMFTWNKTVICISGNVMLIQEEYD